MEKFKGGIKGYWKRRAYHRVDGSGAGGRRRRIEKAELGGGRWRTWRIKISPRLRFLRRLASPKRLLARIRDAYVRMMLGFASSGVFAGGYGYGYGGEGVADFGRPQVKEYDEKMLVEIYKSIVSQGHLIAAAGSGVDGQIAVRRPVGRSDANW